MDNPSQRAAFRCFNQRAMYLNLPIPHHARAALNRYVNTLADGVDFKTRCKAHDDMHNRFAVAGKHYEATMRWEHYLDTQKQRRRLQWWSLLALVINIITTLITLCLPMM